MSMEGPVRMGTDESPQDEKENASWMWCPDRRTHPGPAFWVTQLDNGLASTQSQCGRAWRPSPPARLQPCPLKYGLWSSPPNAGLPHRPQRKAGHGSRLVAEKPENTVIGIIVITLCHKERTINPGISPQRAMT